MTIKLKLFSILFASLITLSINALADDFPKQFTMQYDLLQSAAKVGEIKVDYKQEKNNYLLNVEIKGQGILSLMGNRNLVSQGKIINQFFLPSKFEHRNNKRPKKNIEATFFYDNNLIISNYKGRKIEKELISGTLDLAIYLFQFNLIESKKEIYRFEVFQGKKVRTYEYKKIKDDFIDLNKKIVGTELYEGKIIGREKSNHQVWISKNNYRIPVKLTIPTDIGLIINQVLVSTNLPL